MPLSQIVSASIEDGAVAPVDLSSVAQYTGFKNRIINGAMVIDQRNNGASGTTTNAYTIDRWQYGATQTAKGTWQQNAGAVTPPTGYINYLGFTSSSAYSILSTDTFLFTQGIEGLNCYDLAWGTASAHTVTLSFWVRSSLTGTFGGGLRNGAFNLNYLFSYTINVANTWEQKTITIPGPTSGTWSTSNTGSIYVGFGLGSGSTFSGTANTWQAGNLVQPTGGVSVVGTNGATFYFTGVQLEKGVTATSFDYRPYTTELQLCQRYYASFVNLIVDNGPAVANFPLPVSMRATPTWTGGAAGFTAVGYTNGNTSGYMFQTTRAVNAPMTASAEL